MASNYDRNKMEFTIAMGSGISHITRHLVVIDQDTVVTKSIRRNIEVVAGGLINNKRS